MADPISAILLGLLVAAASGAAGYTGKEAAKKIHSLLNKLTGRAKREKQAADEHDRAAQEAKDEVDALRGLIGELATKNRDLERENQDLKGKNEKPKPKKKKPRKR